MLDQEMQLKFEQLFGDFVESYLPSQDGQWHISIYEPTRAKGRQNYLSIKEAAGQGENVVERVLLQLLPYADTASNRQNGAWIHYAPSINGGLKLWYERKGWTQPQDWPFIATAILEFVTRCANAPVDSAQACKDFAARPYSKGLQTGMLTPILNALRPADYVLINNKPRQVINYFAGTSHGQRLIDYPGINSTARQLAEALQGTMRQFDVPPLTNSDLLDMFSHWLVAVRKYPFVAPQSIILTSGISEGVRPAYILEASEVREINPSYSLSACAADTGLEEQVLTQWIRALKRKGQAILYGPPGTGKTFVAEHLARHLISNLDGFIELVQFHPAYSYEDFIQGIRPKALEGGGLDYPLVAGRFLEFCEKAHTKEGPCVLIIDEINRANLARVFGELMYLLEYRNEQIPLAGGHFLGIPSNVYLIGTMNTADRSIALVDHALRRRFAFLALYPNYETLRQYHEQTGFPVAGLIGTLQALNTQIGNRHYEVGISYFLRENLADELEDIWQMEIEPYLEEIFFDRPEKLQLFGWQSIRQKVLP